MHMYMHTYVYIYRHIHTEQDFRQNMGKKRLISLVRANYPSLDL